MPSAPTWGSHETPRLAPAGGDEPRLSRQIYGGSGVDGSHRTEHCRAEKAANSPTRQTDKRNSSESSTPSGNSSKRRAPERHPGRLPGWHPQPLKDGHSSAPLTASSIGRE